MLLRNNTCNLDLGNKVETGAFQFFECPPMLFSPNNKDNNIDVDYTRQANDGTTNRQASGRTSRQDVAMM